MDDKNNRKFVGRLIYEVITERRNVREAIKLFPESKDVNIECAYHASRIISLGFSVLYHPFV